ncbi:hypothetical protein F4809DRAFT_621070 [Biscogniauxia mediterranea]|nr:hypothetical protein F4809DRAFT_621070 [Biscogniauxia mediterranea]
MFIRALLVLCSGGFCRLPRRQRISFFPGQPFLMCMIGSNGPMILCTCIMEGCTSDPTVASFSSPTNLVVKMDRYNSRPDPEQTL